MKKYFILATNLILLFTASITRAAHDHASVHGMLMVGRSTIYLSHLPIFHSPHDYQVILEVQLSESAKQEYFSHLDSSDETIYTLVPEAFVLPEMIENPRPFMAQIYKGHFERGGQLIADQVEVQISRVIYFKKFDPLEQKPEYGNYLLFGNDQEQFLAHAITAKPDFDQILKIKKLSKIASTLKENGIIKVLLTTHLNMTPLIKGIYEADLLPQSGSVLIEVESNIYLEHGDLET